VTFAVKFELSNPFSKCNTTVCRQDPECLRMRLGSNASVSSNLNYP